LLYTDSSNIDKDDLELVELKRTLALMNKIRVKAEKNLKLLENKVSCLKQDEMKVNGCLKMIINKKEGRGEVYKQKNIGKNEIKKVFSIIIKLREKKKP
jgi:hypothetical protein